MMNSSLSSNKLLPIASVSLDEQVDLDLNRVSNSKQPERNRTVAETLIQEDYDNENFETY